MTEREIINELQSRWVSKQELAEMLNLPERATRAWIADLNKKLAETSKCVLSTSAKKGYHIPNPYSEEDVRLVRSAVAELKAKGISIFERRKPLEDFLKTYEGMESVNQLSLF